MTEQEKGLPNASEKNQADEEGRSADCRTESDFIWKLETNIDDSTGEVLAYCMDLLLEAGARDVNYMPVYMKKGRPAWQLNVICTDDTREKLEEIIFRETSTIGIRRVRMERTVLRRAFDSCEIGGQKVKRKVTTLPDGSVKAAAEFESAKQAAQKSGKPLREILAGAEKI